MVRAHCARVRGSSAAFLGILLALVVPLPCPVLHSSFLVGSIWSVVSNLSVLLCIDGKNKGSENFFFTFS